MDSAYQLLWGCGQSKLRCAPTSSHHCLCHQGVASVGLPHPRPGPARVHFAMILLSVPCWRGVARVQRGSLAAQRSPVVCVERATRLHTALCKSIRSDVAQLCGAGPRGS